MRQCIDVHRIRRGFTAVEVLAALFLAGLLAAVATVWLSGTRESADLDAAVGRIGTCDRVARGEARSRGSLVRLTFDRDGTITEQVKRGAESDPDQPHVMHRSSGVRPARLIMAPNREPWDRPAVSISSAGTSDSYAVQLVAGRQSRWLIVAGLSGNVTEVRDEQQVMAILSGCGTAGDDAH